MGPNVMPATGRRPIKMPITRAIAVDIASPQKRSDSDDSVSLSIR
jgi:hypothetical protein